MQNNTIIKYFNSKIKKMSFDGADVDHIILHLLSQIDKYKKIEQDRSKHSIYTANVVTVLENKIEGLIISEKYANDMGIYNTNDIVGIMILRENFLYDRKQILLLP